MSNMYVDHEEAKKKAEFCISYPAFFKKQEANLCHAYIDMERQRDEANETLVKVADAIQSTHGDDASLAWVADMARLNVAMSEVDRIAALLHHIDERGGDVEKSHSTALGIYQAQKIENALIELGGTR